MEIYFELAILDNTGEYFDTVGEYSNLEYARASRKMYQIEYPNAKYQIYKITREILE